MTYRILIIVLFLAPITLAEDRLTEFYQQAIPVAERFVLRVNQQNDTNNAVNFTSQEPLINAAILVSANADLPKKQRPALESITALFQLAEEMQDKNPDSPTFGNFRWYWNTPTVTDLNAVEFAAAPMLSMYLESHDQLPKDAQKILRRMLERSIDACLARKVRPDYTNIAIYNAVHLILLGQIFDRPDVIKEGTLRLMTIVAAFWDHGVFEYNSPPYYSIDVDTLQFGFRYVKDEQTKLTLKTLLEFFWTDLSLHWYKPGLRLAGAQSRTYNYISGTHDQMDRLFSFAGLAPYNRRAKFYAMLNSFRSSYQPPPAITDLNAMYPRWIARRWGIAPNQWAITYLFDDIALGTAGGQYHASQDMVQTVDIANEETDDFSVRHYVPHSYFIADGREDPYGIKRYPTGRAGHQKALHLDALWVGSQRTVDSLGLVLYPPKAIADPIVTNVQSHFVICKPESIWHAGGSPMNPLQLSQIADVQISPLVKSYNDAIIFRYKNCCFGIRSVWTRNLKGQMSSAYLINDKNDHGVYRLTVDHGKPETPPQENGEMAGAAFWVRIGSHLKTDEQFKSWSKQFIEAKLNLLDVKGNDVNIEVAGVDGVVSIRRTDSEIVTEPAMPGGILTLNGKDLGRPILAKIPAVAQFSERSRNQKPIAVKPSGTYWEAEIGNCFFDDLIEANDSASGKKAVRVNHAVSWQVQIEEKREYVLWAKVLAKDKEHDSFRLEAAKRLSSGSFDAPSMSADWHLGVRPNWTWVKLPIRLEEGGWQLTLLPREPEGLVDQFFLTDDPNLKPSTPF